MHGLYLLWWVGERGISPVIVAAILAAGDLALFVLEVPTGWFADRFGHRASLMLGSSAQALGMVLCWLGRGVPELVAASVLVALGDAFRSGADQALLYRSCVGLGREDHFQALEARTRAAGLVALVVLLLTGGLIVAKWGFAAGWAVEIALSAVGLAIAYAMVEPPAAIEAERLQTPPDESGRVPEPHGRSRLARTVIALVTPAALLGGAVSASSFLAQTTGAERPETVTMLVAAITLAEAAGAALAARIGDASIRGQWLLAAIGGALAVGGMPLSSGPLAVAVALSFLLGVAQPLRATLLQRLAADHLRARAASLASACDMVSSAIALSLAGGWRGGVLRPRAGPPS